MQRTAEEKHFAFYFSALREPCDGLVDYRLKNACGNVLLGRALIEQRLNVALCEHAAARGYRIFLFGFQRKLVKLVAADLEKRRHLVDKRARTACARAVHSLLDAVREKQYFGVFSAQLHSAIGVGISLFDCQRSRIDFLHERNAGGFGKTETG